MTFSPLNAIIDADAAARSGWTAHAVAEACLAGGARFLQVRAKHESGAGFLALARHVVERAHAEGGIVIANDRADIARLAGADGVHVGQDDLDPASVRRIVGGHALVGMSTHTIEQVRAASRLPVDYIAVGPVFATASKETGYHAVGLPLVREARAFLDKAGVQTPLVAIGGITLDKAAGVIAAGAVSVAVISDLLSTGDPAVRVREYLAVLR